MNSCKNLTAVIPTLNVEKTIVRTLESLLPLKEKGMTIILADSFSEDKTTEVSKKYIDELIQVPKGNMYRAINAGIEKATTEWVTYLNADDIIFPDIISKTLAEIDDSIDLFYGDIDFMDWNGRFMHSYKFPKPSHIIPLAASHICGISPIGTVYKKSLWEKLNGFNTAYRYSADFDFLLRAVVKRFNVHKVPYQTVGAFRLHPAQLSQDDGGNPAFKENLKLIENMQLNVSTPARIYHKWHYKLSNLSEILFRLLRHTRLGGKFRLSKCITPGNF